MIERSVEEIKEQYEFEAPTFDCWRDNSKYYNIVTEITQRCIRENLRFVSDEKKVLDAGCGTGRNIDLLLKLGAQEAVGIDLTPSLLGQAQRKFGGNSKVKLFIHNLNDPLPFEDSSFDAIICCKTLPHVHNIGGVLSEFKRVLKKGGVMMLDFYSPYSFRRIFYAIRMTYQGKTSHVRWDSVFRVKHFLKKEDLILEKIYGQRTFMVAEILVNNFGLHHVFRWLENRFTNNNFFNQFSGRFNVVLKKP